MEMHFLISRLSTLLLILNFFIFSNYSSGYLRLHRGIHRDLHEVDPPEARFGQSGQDDYTCAVDTPCPNGACCGINGWCGYGPMYCGNGCTSNCNAKAECGKFAAIAGKTCPLNVCCSEFGFCGTTGEFCGKGCQSNCYQPRPSGPPSNVQKRVVGYWEAWNTQHPCGTMGPGEIPVNHLTHLNVAFGYITPDFRITNMDGLSTDIYRNIGDVKARNPHLKLLIALGGWKFSDPGPWQSVFPTMVSTPANRDTFIKNALMFMEEYGYDGLDFDWEYPGAYDRGGSDKDGVNYTMLLKELRAAIRASGRDYLVTFTAPTSYWYLRHFDIKNMVSHVDWVNLMSYDLHGIWDDTELLLLMIQNATRLLDAGVTTARDLGFRGLTAIALRDMINKGEILGPRLQCANAPLTVQSGHAHALGGVCGGVEGVRAEVRKRHAEGADLIKVMSTGGFLTAGTGPSKAAFSPEEMMAIADEARVLGMPVTTHAIGTEGVERAADARFSSVEHCSWISANGRAVFDTKVAQKMLDNDVAVCPTMNTACVEHDYFCPWDTREAIISNLRSIRETGIRIFVGTDAGIGFCPFERYADGLTVLQSAGYTTREIIAAATDIGNSRAAVPTNFL